MQKTLTIRQLEKVLADMNKRGIPFAAKEMLNRMAYDCARKSAPQIIKSRMTLRNSWTLRSLVYNKVSKTQKNVNLMYSEAGSTEKYMRKQEQGYTRSHSGGIAIPTSAAAGQYKQKPRTRVIKTSLRFNRVDAMKPRSVSGKTEKQKSIIAIQEAIKKKKKFLLYRFRQHHGVWKLDGGRRQGRGWPGGATLTLIYDMRQKRHRYPSSKWLADAAMRATNDGARAYEDALRKQIDIAVARSAAMAAKDATIKV